MLATIQIKMLFSHLLPKHRTLKRSLKPTKEELISSKRNHIISSSVIGTLLQILLGKS